jgi:hypothetical protein
MSDHYILVGQSAVPVAADPYTPEGIRGLLEWGRWFETADRVVFQTRVLGICWVSTVFLGLDHNWGAGPPLLFETMAFWWPHEGYDQERCSTWLEAEEQHRRMCAYVASPRAVLAWVWRAMAKAMADAREDWRRAWRDQRGIPAEDWEQLIERMEGDLGRIGDALLKAGKTTRTPACRCPYCGRKLSAASHFSEEVAPHPGDISICIGCGEVLLFDEGLRVRRPTTAELIELQMRPIWSEIAAHQKAQRVVPGCHRTRRTARGTMKLAVRGYVDGALRFEERLEISDPAELETIAAQHAEQMVNEPRHMIEIEFLDEPDELERFFRFGTDPSGMVAPIGIKL